MKRLTSIFVLLTLVMSFNLESQARKTISSKTHYAEDVLRPYVESGQLPGAISIFYNDGVQETCCIGYADVDSKRRIGLDNSFMQCSQTKGFCGVTIAKLKRRIRRACLQLQKQQQGDQGSLSSRSAHVQS